MSEHTPGPWTARRAQMPSDGGWDWGIGATKDGHDGRQYCIAEAFEIVGYNIHVPAEANARLIAAAPDMLAALKELVDYYTGLTTPPYSAMWTAAIDAVAKATKPALASAE